MATSEPAITPYQQYVRTVSADLIGCLARHACQPILFIGSGLSRRYFNAPSWDELLAGLCKRCPNIEYDYAYYKQKYGSPIAIGELFAEKYQEWAWAGGKSQFPPELFVSDVPGTIYIKHIIKEWLDDITQKSYAEIADEALRKEASALANIKAQAIITTNYDKFLDFVFPDYHPIVGQKILLGAPLAVGEIYKIHGCISGPDSLVFTSKDYEEFTRKKKYLSAKLLTFFSEHPLIFLGYGAGDPNIRAILSDIDEALPISGDVIQNIYFVEWKNGISDTETPATERLLDIGDGKSIRVKSIQAEDFTWIFELLSSQQVLNGVSPKILRAILSRSYHLVRHDIPRKLIQANFEMLENVLNKEDELIKLFGLTTISDPTALSAIYLYSITALAKEMGYGSWQKLHVAINKVDAGLINRVCGSDNRYHYAFKYGKNQLHKYSDAALTLFSDVLKGEKYEFKP